MDPTTSAGMGGWVSHRPVNKMRNTASRSYQVRGYLLDVEAPSLTFVAGDKSNRELVARKCGNEFDKYLACGSGGDNIGIAASGDVICCDNR